MKPGSGQSGPGERHLEELVSSTCEAMLRTTLHPHTAISITLQIENNAGSVRSIIIIMIAKLFTEIEMLNDYNGRYFRVY